MTISKGAAWGRPGPLADTGVVVRDDAEARAVVEAARRAKEAPPPLGLLGGDLCRTLGGTGDEPRLRSPDAMTFPVDLGVVLVDGTIHCFVAHLIARRSWWRGRVVVAMNAQWLGAWDLGPRSHPNDGLLDISDGNLSLSDRWKARSRLPTGTHVPHPGIAVHRVPSMQLDLDPALDLWLDGVRIGRGSNVVVRVEPDALTVVV
jgi:hypothetical protein